MIAVYGGSFNPMTKAHMEIVSSLLKIADIEKVILIPVGDKYPKEDLLDSKSRTDIIQGNIDALSVAYEVEIDTIEIESPGRMFTYDTLKQIQLKYPTQEISFVLGVDNLREINTWHKAEELLQKFDLILVNRSDDSTEFNEEFVGNVVTVIELEKMSEISSSKVRQIVRESGYEKEELLKYISVQTFGYLKDNKLYYYQ